MPSLNYSKNHVWAIASIVLVDERLARRAVLRHSIIGWEGMRINALETYCDQCHRTWDDVAGELCEAAVSNVHMRGGPIGTRKGRTHNHNCQALGCPPPAVNGDDPPMPATG